MISLIKAMSTNKKRRSFDTAFKLQVVKMVKEQGLSIDQAYRDLNLSETVVRRWLAQFEAEQLGQSGIGKPLIAERQHIQARKAKMRRPHEDKDIPKELGLLHVGTEVIYRSIAPLQEKAGGVAKLCRVLKVNRSGYYAGRQRSNRRRKVYPVSVRLQAAFARSGRSYGVWRLQAAPGSAGLTLGSSLMRAYELRTTWQRKFIHTTNSRHTLLTAANPLDRQFRPSAPNWSWVSDITYLHTDSGWLYLAAVMDLHSRKIVGGAIAHTIPAELECSALQMAIAPPGARPNRPFRPQQSVCQQDPPSLTRTPRLAGQHDPKGNC